jgi:hypothetical protein
MLKNTLIILFASLLFAACKKDKENEPAKPTSYAEIQVSHIKDAEGSMLASEIILSDNNGLVMKPGDVYIFKTNAGLFGKFKINSIDIVQNYQLSIMAEVYNADGTTKAQTNTLVIRGTYFCDLDLLTEATTPQERDFKNERLTTFETKFLPFNGARFAKYIF